MLLETLIPLFLLRNNGTVLIRPLLTEQISDSIDIMIIISSMFLQFSLCAGGCGWCIVDDGCVS